MSETNLKKRTILSIQRKTSIVFDDVIVKLSNIKLENII